MSAIMEIWKDIPNYEGLYEVSNLGRVKSLPRYRLGISGCKVLVRGKILKFKIDRYGYAVQGLSFNAKLKTIPIHRLVALAFIGNSNPEKQNQINHKDGNKTNNHVENLEWCTPSYNIREALRIGLRGGGQIYKPRKDSPTIYQYKDGVLIKKYDCLASASRESGILKTSILNCLKGRSNSSGGYVWVY